MRRDISAQEVDTVTLELLAPAGDVKSFEAAIASGADAVYLGLDDFNARMKAENFNLDNISAVVRHAHFFGVKVYVTINTILQNQEFNSLFNIVQGCVRAKVDAYLVQDLGVAYALKKAFPDIVLHASTQMGVHNLYGAKVAEKMGIKRVVLSRETKLEDIKEIRKNTNLEIEYFVQGALCVAFSGNCYMSAKEQGASGNRGLCKQLCRLPYVAGYYKNDKFEKAGEGYLLSAKDLCLANNVKELVDVGVTSFKIEGRLRREGYVAKAVEVYRRILDEIKEGGRPSLRDEERYSLETAFSRGKYLERAYLDNGTPFVVEKRFNNHIGKRIGVVKKVSPFKDGLFEVIIESIHPLVSGDGLKFFDGDVEKASLGVGNPKNIGKDLYSFVTKTAVKVGYWVNLTLDKAGEDAALDASRYVYVGLEAEALQGKPLKIKAFTSLGGERIEYSACSDIALEKAKSVPTDAREIEEQCAKMGGTDFKAVHIDVVTDGVFLPKSVVNGVRRAALEGLKEAIIAYHERDISAKPLDNIEETLAGLNEGGEFSYEDTVTWQKVDTDDASVLLRKGVKVALAPTDYNYAFVKSALESLDLEGEEVALILPIIAGGEDLKVIESTLTKCGIKTLVSENPWGLYFADKGYTVIAGAGHNIANKFAVQAVKALGAKAYCESIEYSQSGDLALKRVEIGGEIPLMTWAHCPFKTLYACDCKECAFKKGLVIKRERHEYAVKRIRLAKCYFQLFTRGE